MLYNANKILEVLNALERKEGERQNDIVTEQSLIKLTFKLVSLIKNAKGFDSRLTSISRKQISRLIELEYGISISSKNFTDLNKNYAFDLLKKVQGLLHLYSNDAEYDFNVSSEGLLEINYFPCRQSLAPPQLLNLLLEQIHLEVKVMCKMWSQQGILGDRRTHFAPAVVHALRAKRFRNIRWPTSNTSRRSFAKFVKPISIMPFIDRSQSQSEFEALIHERSRSLPHLPKEIEILASSLNAKRIEEVEPRYQDLPYFYIYMTDNGCKVGKADRTHRLNKLEELSKRNALIFCLKKDGAKARSAERVEIDFKKYMADLSIMPIDGKKDHYNQHFTDVLVLFLCFINSMPDMQNASSHIFICSDYEYTLSELS